MRVWVIKSGEPLPSDGANPRLFRTGMLARRLATEGHEVTWWSATFDHAAKRFRFPRETEVAVSPGLRLVLLHSMGYRRNVSLRRIADHRQVARAFLRRAAAEPRPDVILCAFPTIELCRAATRFGRAHGIPVALDVRDLWPDIFYDAVPGWAKPLGKAVLGRFERAVDRAARDATAILATSPTFVRWGLAHAGREATPLDRDFPLAYEETPPLPEDVARAEHFWDERGVDGKAEFVACFFGALSPRYELDALVDAARRLLAQPRPFRFVICGNGDFQDELARLAADCPNVTLPGWVGAAEIWTLMRRASVGVVPYPATVDYMANIPNKAVEYLSAGLPVVSSLPGELRALLAEEECGVTYPNHDGAALAAALLELHDDPARRARMRERSRAVFARRFRAEAVLGEMAEHLERIARAGARGAARRPVEAAMAGASRVP
ncbi:MAG: Alpha-D-kanosaminyltransferase [Gemmatimonadetes bacterium]|nr:Alpha-D-kanosaminyltransferase [Gemmatimonadota bacterium]